MDKEFGNKRDSVSGLFPRYECDTIPPGSVLIECVESGMYPDWYIAPNGSLYWVCSSKYNVSCGYSPRCHFETGSLHDAVVALGFPCADEYKNGLEFWPIRLLKNEGAGDIWEGRPVILPFFEKNPDYNTTHFAHKKAGSGKAMGWFFEKVSSKKILQCPFKVGDWVCSSKILKNFSYRVCEVRYFNALDVFPFKASWMWRQSENGNWMNCSDFLVVAHDVAKLEPSSSGVENWNKGFRESKRDWKYGGLTDYKVTYYDISDEELMRRARCSCYPYSCSCAPCCRNCSYKWY